MTDDLVKRLRDEANMHSARTDGWTSTMRVCREAADALERQSQQAEPECTLDTFAHGTKGNRYRCDRCGKLYAQHSLPQDDAPDTQQQAEPVTWPKGLRDRLRAAHERFINGHAPRRIPADPTDADLVLAEVRNLLDGDEPPFWVAGLPREPLYAAPPATQQQAEPAIEQFKRFGADEETDPIERLRAFCSFAMKGQDWLDVEPFFDALSQRQAEPAAYQDRSKIECALIDAQDLCHGLIDRTTAIAAVRDRLVIALREFDAAPAADEAVRLLREAYELEHWTLTPKLREAIGAYLAKVKC
jgi:hypothetical protein